MRGDLAMLELGLISWSMSELALKQYVPTLVPDLCRLEMIEACGFNPRGSESQIYRIQSSEKEEEGEGEEGEEGGEGEGGEGGGLGLVGTAEIPLAGLAANRLFQEEELPSRVVGFSHAYRREAGARGMKSRGLYRLHQFSKVEMFVHCTPTQTNDELTQMVDMQCDLLQQLGLHGRVLQMPTEELGASAHRKLDVEVWMPGRNEFGEVCSASDCTDYQSRRLNTRYQPKNQKNQKNQKLFASTLNATAMAVPRVMLAILETHQRPDGTITVPKPMIPYLGKEIIGTPR